MGLRGALRFYRDCKTILLYSLQFRQTYVPPLVLSIQDLREIFKDEGPTRKKKLSQKKAPGVLERDPEASPTSDFCIATTVAKAIFAALCRTQPLRSFLAVIMLDKACSSKGLGLGSSLCLTLA